MSEQVPQVALPEATGSGPGLKARAGWTLADQVLSSGTNAALSVVVARSVGVDGFGAFSVAFVLFSFVMGLSRATITDPLIVRFSAAGDAARSAASRAATGAALVVGSLAGLGCMAAAVPAHGELAAALLALGPVLPGLLVQDAWRQAFFAANRPDRATRNDAVWAAAQVAGIGGVIVADVASVFSLTFAWGAAACLAAIVGSVQARALPAPRSAGSWLRSHWDLSSKLAADYSVNMGAVHLTMTLVGVIGGLSAVGAIRAAQVLLGPLQVLTFGLTAFALPLLARRATRGPRALLAITTGLTALGGATAVGWLLVLVLLPDAVGAQLLGATWEAAREVLVPMGLIAVLVGIAVGPTVALKALGRADRLLLATLVQAPLILLLGCTGAEVAGAMGAAVGMAVAHLSAVSFQWWFYGRLVAAADPPPPSTG